MSLGKLNKNQLNILQDLLYEYGRGNFAARISQTPDDKTLQSVVESLNILGEELEEGRHELEEKNYLLKDIYETIDEIIYALDISYDPKPRVEFKFISKQVSLLLGYEEETYKDNMQFRKEIMHPEDREQYRQHLKTAIRGEHTRYDYRLKINNSDRYMWLEDQLIPQKDDKGKVTTILGCARDITARKEQEMDVKYAYREIKLIDKINSAALRGKSVQYISDLLLDSLRKFTGVMSSRLYFYDSDEEVLELKAENIARHLHRSFEKSTGYSMEISVLPLEKNQLLQELINKKEHLITSDESKIERIIASHYESDTDRKVDAKNIRKDLQIKTMALIPMIVEDELLGVTTFTSPNSISTFEKDSISRFINHVSFALAKQRTEEKIHEQKKFFESVLHNAPGQIAVLDDKGKFRFINKQTVKDDEIRNWLIGKDDFDYCNKKGLDLNLAYIRQEKYESAIKNRTISEWIDEHKDRNGNDVYILRKYIPHFENNEFQYMVGNGINITKIKEAENENEKLIKELNDKLNELMQFNYIVSHNLRSPVANMLGLSTLMGMDLPDEKKGVIADKIKESAESLDNIIRDLSQVLSARTPLNQKIASFSFLEVVEEIQNNLENQIAESESLIRIDISPEADKLKSIKSYVQSIMFNLISNAIKYRHPNRKLEVAIKAERKGENIEVIVTDNGLGIDLGKHKEDVFKLYKRFHHHVNGTGIGLHLVKIQTEVLGGQIQIESEVDKGTTFKLSIPA
jgi:PAS domain S-box-containing protein